MSRNYDLNPTAAKEANSGGKRITEHGVYTGTFRAAWYEQNEKGTESVQFIFHSDAGQEAGPLALYTHKGDGTELPSYKTLNAIMACVKQRNLTAQRGRVTLFDYDSQKEVEKDKDVYPQLMGKRIGLVLTAEEYETRNGDLKTRLLIGAPFDAETRRMADEVLDQSPDAHALDKYTAWLDKAGRWLKPLQGQRKPAATGRTSTDADQFPDDDIPF